MNKSVILSFVIIFLLNFVCSICTEGQIDINTASLTDLDKLTGIGPAYAQRIVDARPFGSVDDLLNVSGIGEITLANIKTQGLACVVDEQVTSNEEPEQEANDSNEETEIEEEETIINPISSSVIAVETPKNITFDSVVLNTKDIKNLKTTENQEIQKVDKNRLIMYGFVGFSLLIGLLLIIKKEKYKENEFK